MLNVYKLCAARLKLKFELEITVIKRSLSAFLKNPVIRNHMFFFNILNSNY